MYLPRLGMVNWCRHVTRAYHDKEVLWWSSAVGVSSEVAEETMDEGSAWLTSTHGRGNNLALMRRRTRFNCSPGKRTRVERVLSQRTLSRERRLHSRETPMVPIVRPRSVTTGVCPCHAAIPRSGTRPMSEYLNNRCPLASTRELAGHDGKGADVLPCESAPMAPELCMCSCRLWCRKVCGSTSEDVLWGPSSG